MKYSLCQSKQAKELKQIFFKSFADSEGDVEGTTVSELAYEIMTTTNDEDLFIFVAVENEKMVGCILFTRITFTKNINAFLLSPVAILTNYQGKGIGQALIKFGLNVLYEQDVALAFTYGDPNFYSKVGFNQIRVDQVKPPLNLTYPEGWLGQSLISDHVEPIEGDSFCVEALHKQKYW